MEGEEQKNENLEDELLEQEPPLAAAPVNTNTNQEKEQEDVVEEEEGIELGDTIMIEGGRLDRTRGRIYFMDDNLIRILPDGVSDSLKDIPLIDENPDPELGIEGIVILRKAPTHSFVHLLDIRPEQIVTTFTATGEPGPKFTVVSVDEEKDAILLIDETEATVEPIDPFVGIKRDMGFAVMRVNEPPKPVNVAVSEEPVEEQKEQEPLFEFLDEEIEVPQVVEITEIPTFLRNYPDAQQKTDMLQDLLKALDPSSQKNPRRVREARILTEVLFHLRNSLVEYTRAGDAKKEPKETSFKTLADLLKKSKFPLARPVVQTQRVLNLDHSAEHFSKKQGSSDPTEIADPQIQIRYLDDVVKAEINYVENQLGNPTDKDHDAMRLGAGSGGGLPRWYVGWQGFFDSYLQTLPPSGDAKESVTHDNDVFRSEVPVLTRKESQLSGLPPLKDIVEGKMAEAIVDKDFIGKVTFSDLRALGPSYQRYGEKGTIGISENSDEITVLNYLLFPLTYMREFGSTRSGKLAMDMAESITPAETKGSIIWNNGNGLIGEVPTPGSILVIKPDGSSLGNVSVAN
jgi:hypothetical protein